MAKFKVLKQFKDKHTKEIHEADSEIEMTVKRSEEVAKNLDDSYLERLGAPDETDSKPNDKKSKKDDEEGK